LAAECEHLEVTVSRRASWEKFCS